MRMMEARIMSILIIKDGCFHPPPPIRSTHTTVMATLCVNRLMWGCCVKSVKCIPAVTRWEAGINPGQVTSPPMTHQGAIYCLLSSFLHVCTGVDWDDVSVAADESQLCKQSDWSVRGLLQLSRIHLKMVFHHTRQIRRSIYTD